MVPHHDVAARVHFVRMRAFGHIGMGQQFRVFRIGNIDDACAEGVRHVTDIGRCPVDTDLAAPGAIENPDLFKT